MPESYIYFMSNHRRRVLYIGITSDLIKRVFEHKAKITKGFTARYHLNYLVYYEIHCDVLNAIAREKQLKRWRREWKNQLIESMNPDWEDLYPKII